MLKRRLNVAKLKHKNTTYCGKIFRYNTKGMYFVSKLKLRLDEFVQFLERGRNGYSHVDRWSINEWFLDNIINLLGDMLSNLHGYPTNDEITCFEDWVSILETMRECFRQANENTCDEKYIDDYEYRREMLNYGLNLFVKYFNDLWD